MEEGDLSGLYGHPKSFDEFLPDLFRNPARHMFPGAAILASHLEKLKKEGVLKEECGKYQLA